MVVTSGCVTICKDDSNLIGISIGGGAPMCPCLYIVQVTTVIDTSSPPLVTSDLCNRA